MTKSETTQNSGDEGPTTIPISDPPYNTYVHFSMVFEFFKNEGCRFQPIILSESVK